MKKTKKTNSKLRAPVVVVLGHVDHGKTSILDYIRKTSVADKESGKITQHIGAYEINLKGKKITFIDTPGHEAFSSMRSHGSKIADVAVVVVAANEGVKPQTKEAIKIVQEQEIPYLIAFNKIDLLEKHGSIDQTEKQLQGAGVQLEAWGGDIPAIKTSVKTGEGIEDLIETVSLLGEIVISEEKKDNKENSAIVVETKVSDKSGIEAVMLVRHGSFSMGDVVYSERSGSFKIKRMLGWSGDNIKIAKSSQPITVSGLKQQPKIGEIFIKADTLSNKSQKNLDRATGAEVINFGEADKDEIKLIVKFDVLGSYEALVKVLKSITEELGARITIISKGLGNISESDLKLAQSTGSYILGFRVKVSNSVVTTADRLKIKFAVCDVIYNVEEEIKALAKGDIEEKRDIRGKLTVLAVFRKRTVEEKKKKVHKIILGGKVTEGEIKKGGIVDIIRREAIIGHGKLLELEQDRKPMSKVAEGLECGLLYEGEIEIKEGDILEDVIR
jgi:translation initiation factor IF-2